jgi:GT2 family glycosyltransferase
VKVPTIAASIVVCAYTLDRWGFLIEAVESATAQPGDPQVIVVIDHEPALLERARANWPELLVIANATRRGLSGARNTGIAAATGEIVAFLDDDAAAAHDWLSLMAAHFVDRDVVAVGGSAFPVWEDGARPDFLAPELHWIVGCSHAGLPMSVSEVRNVIGSSMVFRRSALLAADGFDLGIGRVGTTPLGCEETELCIRIRQADPTARVVLEPRAIVRHHVTAGRVGWTYLRRRSYFEGVSKAVLAGSLGVADTLSTETAYTRTVLPRAIIRELGAIGDGGAGRAAGIVLSLSAAATGYLRGRLGRVSPVDADRGSAQTTPRIPDLSAAR